MDCPWRTIVTMPKRDIRRRLVPLPICSGSSLHLPKTEIRELRWYAPAVVAADASCMTHARLIAQVGAIAQHPDNHHTLRWRNQIVRSLRLLESAVVHFGRAGYPNR